MSLVCPFTFEKQYTARRCDKFFSKYTPPNLLPEEMIVTQLVNNFPSFVARQGRVHSLQLDPSWISCFQSIFLYLWFYAHPDSNGRGDLGITIRFPATGRKIYVSGFTCVPPWRQGAVSPVIKQPGCESRPVKFLESRGKESVELYLHCRLYFDGMFYFMFTPPLYSKIAEMVFPM